MNEFVPIAKTAELANCRSILVEIEDRLVMIARVGEEYFALDDVCTHDGGPLSDGQFGEDGTIACPRHGAKFDLKTGAARTMPATQATAAHEVRVEGDQILVRLGCEAPDAKPGECCHDETAPMAIAGAASSGKTNSIVNAATESKPSPEKSVEAKAAPDADQAISSTGESETGETAESGEVTESGVLEALKSVIDPELFVNIVDLGLIYTVELEPVEDKLNVGVEMTMTSPACPAGPQLLAQSKEAVSRMSGVEGVEIKLVMEPPWTPDRMTEDAKDQLGIF